jgi:uncharacterized membrane protein YeaQ/YmgE (transglycosylase-associated protein family)
MDIVALLLGGFVVGAVARMLTPGRTPIGCLGTIAVGVAGGVLGGLIGREVVGEPDSALVSLLFSVLGAALILLLLRAIRR